MAKRIDRLPFTRRQLLDALDYAYRSARSIGLDTRTADTLAERVLDRVLLEGSSYEHALADELAKHTAP